MPEYGHQMGFLNPNPTPADYAEYLIVGFLGNEFSVGKLCRFFFQLFCIVTISMALDAMTMSTIMKEERPTLGDQRIEFALRTTRPNGKGKEEHDKHNTEKMKFL